MHNRFAFVGGETGRWQVTSLQPVRGDSLSSVDKIAVLPAADTSATAQGVWRIDAQISNLRYATRAELVALKAVQEPLGRPHARRAAMIPIRKSPAWWDLAQDERRAVFEETSQHTAIGMKYLPAVARQLFHARDLGEPFDFITWFEYAPEDAAAFEDLVARLRATREWDFIEREVDIRLELAA